MLVSLGDVKKEGDPAAGDLYVSVNEACRRVMVSRRTFYRWLADPESGLAGVIVRVPPETGRIRVPLQRFEQWLRGRG